MRQEPLFEDVSPAVVPGLPAAADHPVARDYDRDLQKYTKIGKEANGEVKAGGGWERGPEMQR